MDPRVLLLTQGDDSHAVAVAAALERKGVEGHLWYTSDFPQRDVETARFDGGRIGFALSAVSRPHDEFTTVWNRRPEYVIDKSLLHPADHEFADLNCRQFRKSLFDVLAPRAFWVNPHESVRRLTKLLQAARAREVGLILPDTLFTNDPVAIREFLATHPEGVVYKPLTTLPWRDEETYYMPFTARVTAADLPADPVLRATPGIYQALVAKDHELRVTVMGGTVFTAKVLSQETETGRLDWRKSYHELRMEEGTLPDSVAESCRELMRRLGFVFGCFDFIVTPEGEHVFLEVNQMGQFLFLEDYTDLPLLDAFSGFLMSADPEFRWRRTSPQIRYREIRTEVGERMAAVRDQHVKLPESVWDESAMETRTAGPAAPRKRSG